MASDSKKRSWQTVKLSDLGSVNRGRSRHRPRNDPSLYGGKYPFVQTGDVKSAEFLIDSYSQTYNEKGLAQSKLWDLNTLCITIAANIAESAILKIPACFPDSIVGFQSYNEVSDIRFVKYLLDYLKSSFQLISKGTTQDNLSLEKILSINFLVPGLEEQECIADVLSSYDYLIKNNSRRIQILEEMAQVIYKEWFVKFKFPRHEKVKMVDSGIKFGEIPEGWKIGKLSDLAEIVMGQSPKSEFYNEYGRGLPFHQGVTNFGARFPSTKIFSTEGSRKASAGDILFSVRAPVGRLNMSSTDMILGRGLASIRNINNEQSFQFYQLKNLFQEEDAIGSGSIFNSVTKGDLGDLQVLVPTRDLISGYNELVSPIDKLILSLAGSLDKLRQVRDLLLPNLVSGRIEI